MRWRMSPQTFFLVLAQALQPQFNHIVLYVPGIGFHMMQIPIELDSKVPRGQIHLEEAKEKSGTDTAAPSGSA